MELHNKLNIAGMICNLVGTFILAIALNNVVETINISIRALEFSESHNLVFDGMDKHRKESIRKSGIYVKIGISMVVIGFIIQVSVYNI